MAVVRCPTCDTPLTQDEAAGPACPICAGGLPRRGGAAPARPFELRGSSRSSDPTRSVSSQRTLILAVGVINLVLGSLLSCLGLANLAMGGFAAVLYRQGVGRQHPNAFLPTAAGILAMVGILLLLFGLAWAVAALGVVLRQRWGRILMLILAIPIVLLGLMGAANGRDLLNLALALALVLVGIASFIVLIRCGAGFSRPTA